MTADVRLLVGAELDSSDGRQRPQEPRRPPPPRRRRAGDRADRRETALCPGQRPRREHAAAVGRLSGGGRTIDSRHQRLAPRAAPPARRAPRRYILRRNAESADRRHGRRHGQPPLGKGLGRGRADLRAPKAGRVARRRHKTSKRSATTPIREILRDHLRSQGVDPDKPGKIPGDAFKGKNAPRMPSGVPIQKVRMVESRRDVPPSVAKRVLPVRQTRQQSSYRLSSHRQEARPDQQWTAEVVTMWDAARAGPERDSRSIDQSDHGDEKFVMSLSIGEMFEIDAPEGGRLLCVVRKFDQTEQTHLLQAPHRRPQGRRNRGRQPLSLADANAGSQRPQSNRRSDRPDSPGGRLISHHATNLAEIHWRSAARLIRLEDVPGRLVRPPRRVSCSTCRTLRGHPP